jgi:hypothetical protein
MRRPWGPNFPPVLVHAAWQAPAARILSEHSGYYRAKKRRDAKAALAICEDFCQEATLERLYDVCFAGDQPLPLVVAPAMTLAESQNYLAIGYAAWLANEMGWPLATEIVECLTESEGRFLLRCPSLDALRAGIDGTRDA